MQTYVANVEDGSIDSNRSRNVDLEELMLALRKDTPSLIGPQEHLGRAVPDLSLGTFIRDTEKGLGTRLTTCIRLCSLLLFLEVLPGDKIRHVARNRNAIKSC